LEIQKGIQIQENVVDTVAGNDSSLVDLCLESLKQLKMLHVCSLSFDKLVHDVLPLGAFHSRGIRLVKSFFLFAYHTALDQNIEDSIDNLSDLVSVRLDVFSRGNQAYMEEKSVYQ
jgi:hypothetical protein